MTIQEAKTAMNNGKKITHMLFDRDEFIILDSNGHIEDNNGYTFSSKSFFQNRGVIFEFGWSLYLELL